MSKMTLKQKTTANFSVLLRCMDPSSHLLGKLRSVQFVKDTIPLINQESTEERKINALLNVLCEVQDDIQESVMNDLISALRSDGQQHVANIFRKESDKVPMSDEHYRTLTEKKGEVCHFIDTENRLLDELIRTGVISSTDENDIRSMPGYNEKARKLIEVLTRKSDDAFHGFINALNQTGQSHVIYMLTGEGNSRPLKEEHRTRLLTTKRDYLVNMIDSKSSGLITALMTRGVFSEFDDQRVTNIKQDTNNDRNELVLNLIARKSQSDFFSFISALNDTDQTHVVVRLIGADVVAKIQTVYQAGADGGRLHDVDEELLEYMREMFQTNGVAVRRLNEHLSHNGVTVSGVAHGCIEITFTCESVESLSNFREMYEFGQLEQLLNEAFCFKFASKGLQSLKLTISNEQFERFLRWIPMTFEHREALLSSAEWLADKMTVSSALLDKLSLCRRRRGAIERAATPKLQVKTLLDIVSRRPDSAFTQLLNALKDTNQHEAASSITSDSRTATETNKATVLQKERKEDAWDGVDDNLESLLRSITKAESSYIDDDIRVASLNIAESIQHLREHYSVPSSKTSFKEELERLQHASQLSIGRLESSPQHPGELPPFLVNSILSTMS